MHMTPRDTFWRKGKDQGGENYKIQEKRKPWCMTTTRANRRHRLPLQPHPSPPVPPAKHTGTEEATPSRVPNAPVALFTQPHRGYSSRRLCQSRMPVKIKKNNIRCSCQQTERARGFAKMDSIRDRTAHNPICAEATTDSTPFMESTRFQGDCAQAELSWDTLPL